MSGGFFLRSRPEKPNPRLRADNKKAQGKEAASKKESSSSESKRPFDKKKWRLQKYSQKHKVEQWQNRQKKAVLTQYFKSKDKDQGPSFDVNKIYEEYDDHSGESDEDQHRRLREDPPKSGSYLKNSEVAEGHNNKTRKSKAHKSAQLKLEQLRMEKQNEKEDRIRVKKEKKEAMEEYKKKKIEKYKKINKKTRKGQPVMKGRLEDLLEKIQRTVGQNS